MKRKGQRLTRPKILKVAVAVVITALLSGYPQVRHMALSVLEEFPFFETSDSQK